MSTPNSSGPSSLDASKAETVEEAEADIPLKIASPPTSRSTALESENDDDTDTDTEGKGNKAITDRARRPSLTSRLLAALSNSLRGGIAAVGAALTRTRRGSDSVKPQLITTTASSKANGEEADAEEDEVDTSLALSSLSLSDADDDKAGLTSNDAESDMVSDAIVALSDADAGIGKEDEEESSEAEADDGGNDEDTTLLENLYRKYFSLKETQDDEDEENEHAGSDTTEIEDEDDVNTAVCSCTITTPQIGCGAEEQVPQIGCGAEEQVSGTDGDGADDNTKGAHEFETKAKLVEAEAVPVSSPSIDRHQTVLVDSKTAMESPSTSASAASAVFTFGAAAGASANQRVFYHSQTLEPIGPGEEAVDSEGDDDDVIPDWLVEQTTRLMDDFVDVNEGEKEIMKLWNLHMMENKKIYRADCHIPVACETFVEKYGKEILQRKLYRNCLLHFINLFDFGLLTSHQFHACTQLVQSKMEDGDFENCAKTSYETTLKWLKDAQIPSFPDSLKGAQAQPLSVEDVEKAKLVLSGKVKISRGRPKKRQD